MNGAIFEGKVSEIHVEMLGGLKHASKSKCDKSFVSKVRDIVVAKGLTNELHMILGNKRFGVTSPSKSLCNSSEHLSNLSGVNERLLEACSTMLVADSSAKASHREICQALQSVTKGVCNVMKHYNILCVFSQD